MEGLGKITEIKEICNEKIKGERYGAYDGFRVRTDSHSYGVLIDNGQSCCEHWGYISCNDDLDYFIGAELTAVKLTDTARNTKYLELLDEKSGFYLVDGAIDWDGGGMQFVDFETNRGVFQLAVYNEHNGYYGHDIKVMKDDEVIYKGCL